MWPCATAKPDLRRRPTWPATTCRPASCAGGGLSAAAETTGRSQMDEITHNLLTLVRGRPLLQHQPGRRGCRIGRRGRGAVDLALSRVPRAATSTARAKHVYRDLNPCVYRSGPAVRGACRQRTDLRLQRADRRHAVALPPRVIPEDAVHLLGVAGRHAGRQRRRLWGFNIQDQLKAVAVWPENSAPPRIRPRRA